MRLRHTNRPGDPGYFMLLRGRPWDGYGPPKHAPLWNYRLLRGWADINRSTLLRALIDGAALARLDLNDCRTEDKIKWRVARRLRASDGKHRSTCPRRGNV